MATDVDTLASALSPLLMAQGLDLYDLEVSKGLVKLTLTKPGGIALEDLTSANGLVSTYLDEHEPFERRYTLEITSPGVERRLRTPAHFAAAVGESVKIKTTPEAVADRRVEGTLTSATDDAITVTQVAAEPVTLRYDQIERARTTFSWGPAPKPSPSRGGAPRGQRRSPKSTSERITTP